MNDAFTFTSESVTEGHPDKMADQISDSILDALLDKDPMSRVACETLVTTGMALVTGEITTEEAYVDIPGIVRETICRIGYDKPSFRFDGNTCGVMIAIDEQSNDIAEGVNRVTFNNDPTAHAEIVAIRNACQKLNTFNLEGCELYSSCEPCPMCLSAIYWSHIDKVYYGNSREDAAKIKFDDKFIYDELSLEMKERKIPISQLSRDEAIKAFNIWEKEENKIRY